MVQHRNDLDQLLLSLASGGGPTSSSSSQTHLLAGGKPAHSSSDLGVNRGIQLVAQRYCIDCRSTHHELSKSIQSVLALRKELLKYDHKKVELGGAALSEPTTPTVQLKVILCGRIELLLTFWCFIQVPLAAATPTSFTTLTPSQPPRHHHQSTCFGCGSASTEHTITLLRALAFQPTTRCVLITHKLIRELVEVNLRAGSPAMQMEIRKLLCQLTR